MENKTNIQLLKTMDIEILDEAINIPDFTTLGVYECCHCHWRFIGDCERYDYGYTSETTEVPNFCPMCGFEIEDYIE